MANTMYNKKRIIQEINSYVSIPTLSQFLENNGQDIRILYTRANCWSSFKRAAGRISYTDDAITKHLEKGMANLIHHNTTSFLRFVERFIAGEPVHKTEANKTYAIMLYYALFQEKISEINKELGASSFNEALEMIHTPLYACFIQEISEIVSYLLAHLNIKTQPICEDIIPGLELYGCYTREEVFTLVGRQTDDFKMQGAASGVFELREQNAILLFVTLNKSEKDFSPTTLYNDYLLENEEYFHWQSKNTDSHNNKGGKRYTEQSRTNNKIILFVRKTKTDKFGNTSPFHCFGLVDYVYSHDDRPMNIIWKLHKPVMAQYSSRSK